MKLVDILARDLKVWPNDEHDSIGQACTGALHKSPNWNIDCGWTKESYTMADDWSSVHVTRAQWQAAVDALKVENCAHLWVGWSDIEACELCNKTRKVVVEWNGEGLPPVGTVCEYQCGYVEQPYRHAECTVIAHFVGESGKSLAAFTYVAHDGVVQLGRGTAELFRPIRTPEQIAADRRLQDIADALTATSKAVDPWNVDIDCSSAIRATVEAMIDAGYCKFEIVDN